MLESEVERAASYLADRVFGRPSAVKPSEEWNTPGERVDRVRHNEASQESGPNDESEGGGGVANGYPRSRRRNNQSKGLSLASGYHYESLVTQNGTTHHRHIDRLRGSFT